MNKFLSCDWGTSSFRLRLIQADDLTTIAEEKGGPGIADTYKQWQQGAAGREGFYAAIIEDKITSMAQKLDTPLHYIPVVLSGMASSSIGMADLPYKELPFDLNGADLQVKILNRYIVISGARTASDVMRGEETKAVGCASLLADTIQEQLLILPGTHPKHIVIKDHTAQRFKTFMTGEFFDLLSTRSVLSASVEKGGDLNEELFIEGVKTGQTADLLHASFMVRTNQLLKKIPPQQNYSYLSGLLIGAELKGAEPGMPVYLVGGETHTPLYALACRTLRIGITGHIDADDALIRGQRIILQQFVN